MKGQAPNLLAWRAWTTARPAVRRVAVAMAEYLASIEYPIPDFLGGPNA